MTPGTVMVECRYREDDDGYWLNVYVNRAPYKKLGPFDTAAERRRATKELLTIMKSFGAEDVPLQKQ
jgi:hypothetical protein